MGQLVNEGFDLLLELGLLFPIGLVKILRFEGFEPLELRVVEQVFFHPRRELPTTIL